MAKGTWGYATSDRTLYAWAKKNGARLFRKDGRFYIAKSGAEKLHGGDGNSAASCRKRSA